MKSYYDFMFFSAVCSSFKGFKCVIGRPKLSWKFVRPQKIAEILRNPEKYLKICQPRKIGFSQISNPKNRTSINVKLLTCAPWVPFVPSIL